MSPSTWDCEHWTEHHTDWGTDPSFGISPLGVPDPQRLLHLQLPYTYPVVVFSLFSWVDFFTGECLETEDDRRSVIMRVWHQKDVFRL